MGGKASRGPQPLRFFFFFFFARAMQDASFREEETARGDASRAMIAPTIGTRPPRRAREIISPLRLARANLFGRENAPARYASCIMLHKLADNNLPPQFFLAARVRRGSFYFAPREM